MANDAAATKTDQKKEESSYYHYTDRDSAEKILTSGYIKQSTDTQNDAVYGPGTYLTKLGPTEPHAKIAKNNYDGSQRFWLRKLDKTDVVLEVKTTAVKCPGDRDVYRHTGDIPTKDIQKVYVRDHKAWFERMHNVMSNF